MTLKHITYPVDIPWSLEASMALNCFRFAACKYFRWQLTQNWNLSLDRKQLLDVMIIQNLLNASYAFSRILVRGIWNSEQISSLSIPYWSRSSHVSGEIWLTSAAIKRWSLWRRGEDERRMMHSHRLGKFLGGLCRSTVPARKKNHLHTESRPLRALVKIYVKT